MIARLRKLLDAYGASVDGATPVAEVAVAGNVLAEGLRAALDAHQPGMERRRDDRDPVGRYRGDGVTRKRCFDRLLLVTARRHPDAIRCELEVTSSRNRQGESFRACWIAQGPGVDVAHRTWGTTERAALAALIDDAAR